MSREMKDSGIEWIGEIPIDWEYQRLKNIGEFMSSGIDKKISPEEELVKIINYTDVYGNKSFLLKDKEYMVVSAKSDTIMKNIVHEGDLIFTPSSETIEDIGASALIDKELDNTAFSYHVLRFKFKVYMDKYFKKYLCNNHYVQSVFSSRATGSIRKTLNRNDFNQTVDAIAKYTTLMHSFGAEVFIEALTSNYQATTAHSRLFLQFSYTTKMNMEYYFKNILRWNVTDDCIQEINDQKFEMYIPVATDLQIGQVVNNEKIYNVQPYGMRDIETININDSIVVPTGFDFEIKNISETKGNLVKKDDIYTYTTNLEEVDEFIITVEVFNDTYRFTKDIIAGIALQHTGVMNSYAITTVYNNPDETPLEYVDYDNLTIQQTIEWQTSVLKNGANGSWIFVTYADIYFPETKQYKLNVAALGDIKVSIGTTYDDFKEVVRFRQEGTNSSWDMTNPDRTIIIDATANKRVTMKVEVQSVPHGSAQRIEYYIGYNTTGNSVAELPANWWYRQYSSNKEVITDYYKGYNNESLYSIDSSISSTKTIDEDVNIIYQTGKLDDKFLTTPNSDKQSMDPGSIVIYKYANEVTANYYNLVCADDTDGVLSFFEIYVSNNGVNWTEAFKGLNPNEKETTMKLNNGYTFRYVKLVFSTQYTGNYIDICNFSMQLKCDDLQIVDFPNELLYTGNASIKNNSSNLNNNYVEFDSTVKFSFTGTSILFFANTGVTYGEIHITIDGVTHKVILNSSSDQFSKEVLSIGCLEDKVHEVEIKVISGLGNIDFIAIDK